MIIIVMIVSRKIQQLLLSLECFCSSVKVELSGRYKRSEGRKTSWTINNICNTVGLNDNNVTILICYLQSFLMVLLVYTR